MPSHSRIPDEILTDILKYLAPDRRELLRTSLVCKRFRECTLHVKTAFEHVYCVVDGRSSYGQFAAAIVKNTAIANAVRTVTFLPRYVSHSSLILALRKPMQPPVDEHSIRTVIHTLPKVDSVNIVGLHWHAQYVIGNAVDTAPLSIANLSMRAVTMNKPALQNFRDAIRRLNIREHLNVGAFFVNVSSSDPPPFDVVHDFPHLSIDISNGSGTFFVPPQWRSALDALPRYHHLRHLSIDGVRGCDVEGLRAVVANCQASLRSFRVGPADPVFEFPPVVHINWRAFTLVQCTNLRTVTVALPTFRDDYSVTPLWRSALLLRVAESLPQGLETFAVEFTGDIKDSEFDSDYIGSALRQICNPVVAFELSEIVHLRTVRLGLRWEVNGETRRWTHRLKEDARARLRDLPDQRVAYEFYDVGKAEPFLEIKLPAVHVKEYET